MDNKELSVAFERVNGIQIGPMKPHEAENTASFFEEIVSSLPYYNSTAKLAEIAKYSSVNLSAYCAEEPDSVLLARQDGAVVGICVSRLDDTLIWLSWFLVDKCHRRKRIGTLLIESLEVSARKRGIHKIWCDCRTENSASKRVLIQQEFLPLCVVRNHWYGQDFILWEKSLV